MSFTLQGQYPNYWHQAGTSFCFDDKAITKCCFDYPAIQYLRAVSYQKAAGFLIDRRTSPKNRITQLWNCEYRISAIIFASSRGKSDSLRVFSIQLSKSQLGAVLSDSAEILS